MSKISVIVPIYNVEKYLEKCLDSLLNQTLYDIEIICIDDCSTDNSLKILREYEKKDSRFKVISFDTKQNAAIARNAGLEIAIGDYLGFVDSDDFVDLDFYEKLYNKAIDTNADIVKGSTLIVELNGSEKKSVLNESIKQNKMNFLHQWWSAIYKHSMIKEHKIQFPKECPKAQDVVFLNNCLIEAQNLELINNTYYHYIRRYDSLDNEILSDVSLISEMRAINLILESLNKSHPSRLNDKEYMVAYNSKSKVFLNSLFRTNNLELKRAEIESLINAYNKCHKKKEFLAVIPVILQEKIKNNDIELIYKMATNYHNASTFYKELLLQQLRHNTKKKNK